MILFCNSPEIHKLIIYFSKNGAKIMQLFETHKLFCGKFWIIIGNWEILIGHELQIACSGNASDDGDWNLLGTVVGGVAAKKEPFGILLA